MEPVAVAPCSACRAPRCCPRHRNPPGPGDATHAAVAELPQEGGDEPCPPIPPQADLWPPFAARPPCTVMGDFTVPAGP